MKNGPLFAGRGYMEKNFLFSRVSATKFVNSYFTSENNAKFYKSTFSQFLEPVISVNSHEVKGKFEMLPQDFSFDQNVVIQKCHFIRINNQRSGAIGGAIFYVHKKGKLKIFTSCFQWCYARQRCGAFFSSAKIFVGKSLCILDCRASKTIMAFSVTTSAQKARANITASFITFCGAIIPKNERDQIKFEYVSLDLMNTNFSQNRVLQNGFIVIQKLYDAAISRCAFNTNYGPSFLDVYSSFDIYLSYSNIISNNLRGSPIITSFESPVYITYSYFHENFNFSTENTFKTEEGGLIVFGNCSFSNLKTDFGYLKGEVKFPKCKFNVTAEKFNKFNDVMLCSFYTDPPSRSLAATPTALVLPSKIPTPTIIWFPVALNIHRLFLICTIIGMLPVLVYAFITKRKAVEIQAFDA